MLHESKRLEQRLAQNHQAISSLENSLQMKMPQNYMNFGASGDPTAVGSGIYSGLSAT